MDEKLRVLIVDDTVTYRRVVSNVLAELPDVEVVGLAANGKIALEKTEQLHPDLLLLDVEMPEMDGLEVLRRLPQAWPRAGAIMLSAFTTQGARTTVNCLELGAFDFVLKPAGASMEENVEQLRRELKPRLAAFARQREVRAILGTTGSPTATPRETVRPAPPPGSSPYRVATTAGGPAEVVAIGISTGGPKALSDMLPQLPASLSVPVLIVQHMPPVFTQSLAEDLDHRCALQVREARDGQEVRAGEVLIAPGGRQTRVRRDGPRVVIETTDDAPENSCKPSVDYLFRSIGQVYGGRSVAVIMTGMGSDGTAECRMLKRAGATLIAQDAATCVVFGMPRMLVDEGLADVVAPLDQIACEIVRAVGRRVAVPCM